MPRTKSKLFFLDENHRQYLNWLQIYLLVFFFFSLIRCAVFCISSSIWNSLRINYISERVTHGKTPLQIKIHQQKKMNWNSQSLCNFFLSCSIRWQTHGQTKKWTKNQMLKNKTKIWILHGNLVRAKRDQVKWERNKKKNIYFFCVPFVFCCSPPMLESVCKRIYVWQLCEVPCNPLAKIFVNMYTTIVALWLCVF